jgi:hypothetical protein
LSIIQGCCRITKRNLYASNQSCARLRAVIHQVCAKPLVQACGNPKMLSLICSSHLQLVLSTPICMPMGNNIRLTDLPAVFALRRSSSGRLVAFAPPGDVNLPPHEIEIELPPCRERSETVIAFTSRQRLRDWSR